MSERHHGASCLHCKQQIRDGQLHVVVFSKALQQRLRTLLAHYFACSKCVAGLPGELPSSEEVYIFRAVSSVEGGVHLVHEVVHGERVFSLTFEDAVHYIGNADLRRELTRSDRLRRVEA